MIAVYIASTIVVLVLGAVVNVRATLLVEEGFNYPTGSNLAVNPPWAGTSGTTLSISSGNLNISTLRDAAPPGNMLRCGGGGRINYRPFSPAPVTNGAIYGSFLLNVINTPTNAQFIGSLMASGVTNPNQPDDPLDLYIIGTGVGYTFRVGHTGDDPAQATGVLTSNTVHLIVFKYSFPSPGRCSIYFDPVPGQPEPASPNAITENEGSPAANLQNILFNSPGTNSLYYIDTLRIGSTWTDVTPIANPLTVTGPADLAICDTSPVLFSTAVTGTAPFTYQWRTNTSAIAGATDSSYSIANPTSVDASRTYDVIVHDTFGAITSRVATLSINTAPPTIINEPHPQMIVPDASLAAFKIDASGQSVMYQWRSNSVAIAGATNGSYTIANPQPADALVAYDVIVANACGSLTSSQAGLVFLNRFLAADGIPGFFGGMNLFTTNGPSASLFAWSSPDLTVPLATWMLEGQLGEQPLNDGSGDSRYTISVNPSVSPTYYVIGQSVAAPYLQPIPVETVTTAGDGSYSLIAAQQIVVAPPQVTAINNGGILQLNADTDPDVPYSVWVATNLSPPISWTIAATNQTDSSGLIDFSSPISPSQPSSFYRISIP